MKSIQKINDAAVGGGWSWKYEPSDYEEVAFAHYMTPLLEPAFWEAVCVSYKKPAEDAKKVMVEFAELLFEKKTVEGAVREIIMRLNNY